LGCPCIVMVTKGVEIDKMTQIQWVENTIRLSDLKPFEQNPRSITVVQARKLKESIEQDGYHSRIKATRDGRVIGGHQRLRILKELGFKEIQVLQPDSDIDDEQFIRIMLRDNHNNGIFDMDMLCNYELPLLHEIGLHEVSGLPPEHKLMEEAEKGESSGGGYQVECPECNHVFNSKEHRV